MYNDEVREHYGITKDSYHHSTTKNTIVGGQNNKQRITAAITVCPECGSENLEHDYAHAELCCADCGMVIEEEYLYIPTPNNLTYSDRGHYSPLSSTHTLFRSEPEKVLEDIINSRIPAILTSFDLRKSLREETMKTVKWEYKELYKNGFTRLGRKPYREAIASLYTYVALNEYLPKNDTRLLKEFVLGFAFGAALARYFNIGGDRKKKWDKYGNKVNDDEAWHKVFKTDLDRQEILTLLERAKKAKGNEIREKGEQSGLINKNCFSLCSEIYSLKMLGKVDGCRYLKTDEEIINSFGVPRRTFKRRMSDLYVID